MLLYRAHSTTIVRFTMHAYNISIAYRTETFKSTKYTYRNGRVSDRMTGSVDKRGSTLLHGYTCSSNDRIWR